MSPGGDREYSIGEKIETPYGEGVIQSTSRETVTVFIRGQGSHKFPRADLREGESKAPGTSEDHTASATPSGGAQPSSGTARPDRSEAKSSSPPAPSSPEPATADLPAPELEPIVRAGEASTGPDRSRRRAAIESLRLGTVPSFAVREATVSRGPQVDRIESVISSVREHGEGRLLLFTGPNGSGKTHLLRLTEQVATDTRFLIARSELEGATKLTPKDVYREAVTNLQWRASDLEHGTLRRFLAEHRERLKQVDLAPLSESRVLYYLLRRLRNGHEVAPEVWDYIHGDERYAEDLEDTRFKTTWLAFWGTAGQALGNAMNGLAYLSRALGYAGFGLIVDETELLLNQDVDWAVRGREWLRGLVLSVFGGRFQGANGAQFEEWTTRPYRSWDSWPGQNISKSRQEWSLRYGGVHPSRDPHSRGDPLPYAPCGDVPFLLALGYTDQPDSNATVFDEHAGFEQSWLPAKTVEDGIFEMEPPRPEDVNELIHQMGRLYVDAYPDSEEHVSEALSTLHDDLAGLIQARLRTGAASSIRWAIQTVVETLDRAAAGVAVQDIQGSLGG